MGYIEDLRSIIGNRKIILNGCIVFIINSKNKCLNAFEVPDRSEIDIWVENN